MPVRIRLNQTSEQKDKPPDSQLPLVIYNELRTLARGFMRGERAGHSLEPTALVHEAYLRIVNGKTCEIQSRSEFFRFAARAMREILVDHARARMRQKRGGDLMRVTFIEGFHLGVPPQILLNMDEALKKLEKLEPQAARVVELRFFVGMSEEEIANELGVSLSTIKREWTFARAWLKSQLDRQERRT
jgi:RNA polymerase sigma factor (TIGR02999 family)